MEKALLQEKELKVLTDLFALLDEVSPIVEWSAKEDNGFSDLILSEHPDMGANEETILGEYTFLPIEEEDPRISRFSVSLVLADDLDPKSAARLYKPLCRVNSVLPAGAFLLSADDKVLSFHRTLSIPAEADEETMYDFFRYEIQSCLELTALWMAALLYLADGSLSEDAFEAAVSNSFKA